MWQRYPAIWMRHEIIYIPLRGTLTDHWSVRVNGNWRLTFKFEKEDVVLVDYQDYH